MKLLLINPRFPESFWSFKWAFDTVIPRKRTVNPPLGLATLAALCPEDWDVEIVDENVQSVPLDPDADIVGVCGMGVQFARQRELLSFFRNKGYYVVAGGSYASLQPEEYSSLADTVVAGESEYVWRRFVDDFVSGRPQPTYHEKGAVELSDSPTPRLDLLSLDRYRSVGLQFSRGCPFRCEFCDIIVMFGRRPRTKSTEQIGKELDVLREHGVRNVFFVDDNFIGDKPSAKKMLSFLRDYQRRHDYQFRFGTEASLNLAQDDELLELVRDARFQWVFIGIESPDEESLKETKKYQNTRGDIVDQVRHIYSYGIEVFGGFIVGFDHDTVDTFDRQYRFIVDSGIQAAMVGLLQALPRTPLYERLEAEGRLIDGADGSDNTKLGTNVIPKGMAYSEMVSGYRTLYERLLESRAIADRIKNKLRYFGRPLRGGEPGLKELLVMGMRTLRGVVKGGVANIYHFLRSLPVTRPNLIPVAVSDWVVGLSMRDYAKRHIFKQEEAVRWEVARHLDSLRRAFERQVHRGALDISLVKVKNSAASLSLSLRAGLDRKFFRRAPRHLRKLLDDTTANVTLHIDEFHEKHLDRLHRLLNRLSHHGERISICVREDLRDLIQIDSSVFNLTLVPE